MGTSDVKAHLSGGKQGLGTPSCQPQAARVAVPVPLGLHLSLGKQAQASKSTDFSTTAQNRCLEQNVSGVINQENYTDGSLEQDVAKASGVLELMEMMP